MEFRSHGEYHIKVLDDVLYIDAEGPFNSEAVHDFQANIGKAVTLLEAKPRWYQLAILHNMSIFTEAAIADLVEVARWRMSKGLVASAVVTRDVVGVQLARKQLGDMYRQLGMEHQFFDTENAAIQWIDTVRAKRQSAPG